MPYLSVSIPEAQKEIKKRGNPKDGGKIEEIEESLAAVNDLLSKKNRDDLDALYNIDTDNLSSSLRRLLASYSDGITSAKAEIKVWADAQQAGFDAIAEWQDDTLQSIAEIKGTADANSAQINLLTQWKSTTTQTLSSIQQETSANSASITALANWKTTAESDIDDLIETTALIRAIADENEASISQIVTAVGRNGQVNAASIVAAVNASGSSVKIGADHVEIDGFVTFTDLKTAGKAEISGNNIALLADEYCDSESTIKFQKYDEGSYTNLAVLETIDNGSAEEDLARFAFQISTKRVWVGSTRYRAALKLYAEGSISIESNMGKLFAESYDDVQIVSRLGTIRLEPSLSSGNTSFNSGEYTFCTDGIYYGNKLLIAT